MKMDFEEFCSEVFESIRGYLPENYRDASVDIQKVTKGNDQILTGIVIRDDDSEIVPVIYLEGFYEEYKLCGEMKRVLQDIVELRLKSEAPSCDISWINDFDQVKDKINCRLINTAMNAEYLSNKPHTLIADLAVVYDVDYSDPKLGQGKVVITTDLMKKRYGVTTEELHEAAMLNLSNSQIVFRSMWDYLMERDPGWMKVDNEAFMLSQADEDLQMYCLTNKEWSYGATAILDSKTMNMISLKMGGNFFILPASVHECFILPFRNAKLGELEDMVRQVNKEVVLPEEQLSDHVYLYDADAKKIVRADKYLDKMKLQAS